MSDEVGCETPVQRFAGRLPAHHSPARDHADRQARSPQIPSHGNSLQPAHQPGSVKTLPIHAREEIFALFPEIAGNEFEPSAAHQMPCGRRQKNLLERHVKSAKESISI